MTVTKVVVLGVEHSAQLLTGAYQPAAFRAFFDRVAPDVIGVERSPDQFARNNHYEFTYEIQHLTLPYAREHRKLICPFDWVPPTEDQLLGWGFDLESLPFLRRTGGFKGFLTFTDPKVLERSLFYAEHDDVRMAIRQWYESPAANTSQDLPRRLFLYRTFMQARRIVAAAAAAPGGIVLVVVGAMHKQDIEEILGDDPGLSIVQPSAFGMPTPEEINSQVRANDFFAIASFNLLGVQSRTGVMDKSWVEHVVEWLESESPGPEASLLSTRLSVLSARLSPAEAIRSYTEIRETCPSETGFTWTGVVDSSRLDSYFDPFGNLGIRQRATLELARERIKVGDVSGAESAREEVMEDLLPLQRQQLLGYWQEYVEDML